ncbi:hypothetical protein PG989_015263 [Apiospora arundinis]
MPCFGRRKSDGTHATPEVLRPLGVLEKFESAMHSLNVYYGCALTCRYTVAAILRGAQAEDALREHFERAVALAVLDHPMLQVGLVGEDTKNPVWVRLDRIDLRQHIQWQTIVASRGNDEEREPSSSSHRLMDTVLEETIKAQHDMPYPDLETRPGWKMIVLHSPDLDYVEALFGVSHANADGESAKFFQQTLLEKLNLLSSSWSPSSASSSISSTPPAADDAPNSGLLQQLQGHILTLPAMSTSTFTPAHESLVDLSLSPAWAVSTALKEMLPSWLRPHPLQVLDWAPQKSVPIRTALRLVHVDAAALRCVLDACRSHETTLTGLIQAIAITSLAMRTRTPSPTTSIDPRRRKKSPTTPAPIVLGTPVSMHRYIRPSAAAASARNPERIVVNSVTYCFHHYHGRRLATLYDLAANVAQDNDDANHEKTCLADNAATNAQRLEDALWEQAARVRRQLAAKLAQGTRNDLTGLLRFVPDFRGRMMAEMAVPDRPRDVTVEVSNLGVMDGEVAGSTKTRLKKEKKLSIPHTQMETTETDGNSLGSIVSEKEAAQDFGHVAAATALPHEEGKEDEDDKNKDNWTIERAMFTQSGIPHGVGLVVSPIAVKGKGLTIAVNWQGDLVDEGVAGGLAADLEAWLGSLGREERISFCNSKVKAG